MRKIALGFAVLCACGGAAPKVARTPPATLVAPDAFKEALSAFALHESHGDWSPPVCAAIAKRFEEAGGAIAMFDAGLASERCDDHAAAIPRFERATALDGTLSAARVELV